LRSESRRPPENRTPAITDSGVSLRAVARRDKRPKRRSVFAMPLRKGRLRRPSHRREQGSGRSRGAEAAAVAGFLPQALANRRRTPRAISSRLSGLAFKEFLDDHRTGGALPRTAVSLARPRLETIVRLRHRNQDESEATTTGVVTGRLDKDNNSMRVADFGSQSMVSPGVLQIRRSNAGSPASSPHGPC